MVRVSVSDRGIGLKNVDIDQLSPRFYQGRHNQRGSGIGLLSASRQLVGLHGGSIRSSGPTVQAARRRFEIPQTASRGVELGRRAVPGNVRKPCVNLDESVTFSERDLKGVCSHYSILVVEDNTAVPAFHAHGTRGIQIVVFRRRRRSGPGTHAGKHPDIVVSDVMMPG